MFYRDIPGVIVHDTNIFWIFLSAVDSCTASSECVSGEGCNSAGVCGTYIYLLCSWQVIYTEMLILQTFTNI